CEGIRPRENLLWVVFLCIHIICIICPISKHPRPCWRVCPSERDICEHLAGSYVDEAVNRPLKGTGIVSCLISGDRRRQKRKRPDSKSRWALSLNSPPPKTAQSQLSLCA